MPLKVCAASSHKDSLPGLSVKKWDAEEDAEEEEDQEEPEEEREGKVEGKIEEKGKHRDFAFAELDRLFLSV